METMTGHAFRHITKVYKYLTKKSHPRLILKNEHCIIKLSYDLSEEI